MKIYKANKELEEILINHGYIDVTTEYDIVKGRKLFKFSKSSQKQIYFNYDNIIISKGSKGSWNKFQLTEVELKSILYYFSTKSTEYSEFDKSGYFNFEKFEDKIISLRKELEGLTEYNHHLSRRIKIKRILDNYDKITF